jgi:hypothetical protein
MGGAIQKNEVRFPFLLLSSLAISLLSGCGRDLSTAAGTVEEF